MKHFSVKNKVVFITGATSGIGEACAHHFAEQGARLLICGRRLERLKALAAVLKKSFSTDVHYFALDVSKKNTVKETLAALPDDWKAIEILVNNAGLARNLNKLHEGSMDDWDEMIDTNIKGLLYVTRQVLPGMIERNTGHIINIGSIAGQDVYPNGAVYASTKHAVNAISRALRLDLLGTPIRVTEIAPGMAETEFSIVRFQGDTKRAKTVYEGMVPLSASDVADAVYYCASRPPHVNISQLVIMPTAQAGIVTVARK